jgi:hypothetical protein
VAICALGLSLMALAVSRNVVDGDDFRQFYRAATLAGGHESVFAHPSFSPATNADSDFLPFNRIPFYAAALRPLAALSYPAARRVWLGIVVLAFAGCVWLFPLNRGRFAVALSFSLPVVATLTLGQDIGLVLLIALAAARIWSKGREFLAGMTASLLAIKLSFLPAVAVVFLAKSRRGTLGLALGVAVQLAISTAWEGIGWPLDYLALLRKSALWYDPRRMPNIRALTVALSLPEWLWPVAAAVLLGWLFTVSRRLSVSHALILALPLGLIASPYGFLYDAVVLVPLLVSVFSFESWGGYMAAAALAPIPYLLSMSVNSAIAPLGAAIVVASALVSAASLSVRTPTESAQPS